MPGPPCAVSIILLITVRHIFPTVVIHSPALGSVTFATARGSVITTGIRVIPATGTGMLEIIALECACFCQIRIKTAYTQ